MINLKQLKKSFLHAVHGVKVVFQSEQSFRIQVIVAIIVLLFAVYVEVTDFEMIVLILLVGSILSLEMINSIFERIIDTFKPRIHPIVKDIKDIMAGTVLVGSLMALFVGLIIFAPYVYLLYTRVA